MSVSYRLIEPRELDAGLIEAWRSIQLGESRYESPYFCPEFTQTLGEVRRDVRIVVIENDRRPVGFFPHQRAPLGHGQPAGGPLSDYHGVVTHRAAEWSVGDLMRAARLVLWRFDHLVDGSGRFAPHVRAHATSPQIDLGAGFGQYLRGLGDSASDCARKARKLGREVGALSFSVHSTSAAALQQLLDWKRAQYRRTGAGDCFAVRWTGELLRRLMEVQSPHFAGVCSTLCAGERLLAVHAGMRSARVLHWWFPAYDASFGRYSPGIILLLRLAEAAAQAGLRAIDLGKGDARYKHSFMTGAADLAEGVVELPSLLLKARGLLPPRVMRRLERTLRFH